MKKLLIILLSICLANSFFQKLIVTECPPAPDIDSKQDRIIGSIPYFLYQNSTGVSNISTSEILDITFNVADTQMVSNYTQCNDPLYNQDVVQVDPYPHGDLFVSNTANSNDSYSGIKRDLIPCDETGIIYSAQIFDFEYKVNLQIPVKLITGYKKANQLKADFFRINCSLNGPIDYSGWRSTLYSPPCFHKPSFFGDIYLP